MKTVIQLAPIKGVTDRTFRNAFARHFGGLDSAIAPFITKSDSAGKIKSLSPEMNPGLRTVPQILAKSPDDFIFIAEKLKDMGCNEVNWNLGCPFAMVVKRGEGAAMLQYPDMIESFLEKVFSKMTVALSVKMRLGMHSPDEIRRVIPVINSFPVKEIIIHPRTGVQMYDGVINHEAFDAALLLSRHPVIYNGDIRSAGDYTGLQIKYPSVSGWMIGRGLLMNPFLAMEIKNGRDESDLFKTERLKQFTDYLCDAYIKDLQSPAHVLDKMKGVWHYLSHSFNDSRRVEKKIRKAGSLNHYRDEVRRLFEKEAGQLSRA